MLIVVSGCGSSEPAPKAELSFERYEAAVFAYRDCLAASGYGIDLRTSTQTGELYEYFVPAEASADGTDDRCYLAHLDAIDAEWQRDVYSRNPELDQGRRLLADCATAFGLAVPEAATLDEVYDLIIASGRDVTECLEG